MNFTQTGDFQVNQPLIFQGDAWFLVVKVRGHLSVSCGFMSCWASLECQNGIYAIFLGLRKLVNLSPHASTPNHQVLEIPSVVGHFGLLRGIKWV